MNIQNIDRAILKSIIQEIIKEDVTLFKETIKEVLIEHQVIVAEEQVERRNRLERFLDDDFERYDEVFKALA